MIIKKTTIEKNTFSSLLPKDIEDQCIFLDIETTGLSKLNSEIFMAGFLYKSDENYILQQLFSTSSDSEWKLTNEMSQLLKEKKYIITYNGNSFDIPFYIHRCKINNQDTYIEKKIMLDLYQILSRYKQDLNYVNYKLKTVEKKIGISREDTLTGKDIIKLNTSYRINPKNEYLEVMLLHNFEDIYNLPFIMKFLRKFQDNKCTIIRKPELNYLFFNTCLEKKTHLTIRLKTLPANDIDVIVNSFYYKYMWTRKKGLLEFELLTSKGLANGKNIKYVNLKYFGFVEKDKYMIVSNDGSPIINNILLLIKLILDKNVS